METSKGLRIIDTIKNPPRILALVGMTALTAAAFPPRFSMWFR